MRTCHGLAIVLLALLSGVSAERPARVIATIPNERLLAKSEDQLLVEPGQSNDEGDTRLMKNVEVTGFITKNGDLYEVGESRDMGSIEARQEPEPGMTMCRYGTIVVYSDADCNTFFKPSQNLGAPVKAEQGDQSDIEEPDEKPLKKKTKKTKGKKRKSNRNKVQKRRKNNKRKNTVRRKALKRGGSQNRRKNTLNQQQKQKRRKNQQNKKRNQKRRNNKRKRINRRD